ncbi:MAG: type II toxin-antitoxin system RelE/ParE family toxin [Planctomycetaceae bacterium]|nr:type II toxin-antitoxin system RelE/ParE family toxin [Planctomycetaceae bacterium]
MAFHPEAQSEYTEARQWYAERNLSAAERFEAEVDRLLELIVARPEMFGRYDDQHRFAVLRRFPYRIIYQVHRGRVFVIALPHANHHPDYWMDRR